MPMGQELTPEEYAEYQDLKAARENKTEPAFSAQLTPEEVAEYRALQESAKRTQEEYDRLHKTPDPTHYLHLADGTVVESAGTMTHYKGQLVLNSVPKEA